MSGEKSYCTDDSVDFAMNGGLCHQEKASATDISYRVGHQRTK